MRLTFKEWQKTTSPVSRLRLIEQSYSVDIASDGETGERLAEDNVYDVILIDIMIPRKSGFSLCKCIRELNPSVPIMMLTELDSTEDKLRGFDAGAIIGPGGLL
jgi:DNA-binding response OmpR family regulator